MSFIGNLLIKISNNTIPLAFIIIICCLISQLIQGIGKLIKIKNDFTLKEIAPKVKQIQEQYQEENEQLNKLSELYKEYHFSAITPIIFKIVGIIFYIVILTAVFYGKNFNLNNYTNSISFFTIDNIFERTWLFVLPVIIIIFKTFARYIFIPKELTNIKDILINIGIDLITTIILTNILIPTYTLFLLGNAIMEFIINIPFNKKRKQFFYQFPSTKEEMQTSQTQNKKSIKELMKDLNTALNDTNSKETKENITDNQDKEEK